MTNGINRITHPAPRVLAGVGHVIISAQQNTVEYIQSCYRNNRVTIITDRGEVIKDCFVGAHVWNYLNFPKNKKERGSLVAWTNIPYQNRVIIVAVLTKKDELQPVQLEHQFRLERKFGNGSVSITGNGQTGSMVFAVEGESSGEGEVYFKVLNENELAFLQMYVQGKIEIDVENAVDFRVGQQFTITVRDEANPQKSATIRYNLGEGFELLDEFNNQLLTKDKEVNLTVDPNFTVTIQGRNNRVEKNLLGETTQHTLDLINNLVESMILTLQIASVSPPNVVSPIIKTKAVDWVKEMTTIKNQTKKILSKNLKNS